MSTQVETPVEAPKKRKRGRETAFDMVRSLGLVILVGGPDAQVDALVDWFPRLLLITGIWFATGPLWHLGSRAEPTRTQTTRSR